MCVLTNCPHKIRKHNSKKDIYSINNPSIGNKRFGRLLYYDFHISINKKKLKKRTPCTFYAWCAWKKGAIPLLPSIFCCVYSKEWHVIFCVPFWLLFWFYFSLLILWFLSSALASAGDTFETVQKKPFFCSIEDQNQIFGTKLMYDIKWIEKKCTQCAFVMCELNSKRDRQRHRQWNRRGGCEPVTFIAVIACALLTIIHYVIIRRFPSSYAINWGLAHSFRRPNEKTENKSTTQPIWNCVFVEH